MTKETHRKKGYLEFIFQNGHESIKISGNHQAYIINGAGRKSWPMTHISTTKREVKMINFLNAQSLSPVTFFLWQGHTI